MNNLTHRREVLSLYKRFMVTLLFLTAFPPKIDTCLDRFFFVLMPPSCDVFLVVTPLLRSQVEAGSFPLSNMLRTRLRDSVRMAFKLRKSLKSEERVRSLLESGEFDLNVLRTFATQDRSAIFVLLGPLSVCVIGTGCLYIQHVIMYLFRESLTLFLHHCPSFLI
jgi:hypothetical protein